MGEIGQYLPGPVNQSIRRSTFKGLVSYFGCVWGNNLLRIQVTQNCELLCHMIDFNNNNNIQFNNQSINYSIKQSINKSINLTCHFVLKTLEQTPHCSGYSELWIFWWSLKVLTSYNIIENKYIKYGLACKHFNLHATYRVEANAKMSFF